MYPLRRPFGDTFGDPPLGTPFGVGHLRDHLEGGPRGPANWGVLTVYSGPPNRKRHNLYKPPSHARSLLTRACVGNQFFTW